MCKTYFPRKYNYVKQCHKVTEVNYLNEQSVLLHMENTLLKA